MPNVSVEITLPAAPVQAAPQANRVVTITVGGQVQPSVTIDVAVVALPPIQADVAAPLQVSVVEALANGKQSAPCTSPVVNLVDHVEAVAADPAGFAFKVLPAPA